LFKTCITTRFSFLLKPSYSGLALIQGPEGIFKMLRKLISLNDREDFSLSMFHISVYALTQPVSNTLNPDQPLSYSAAYLVSRFL
jgi:hypothetical protein